MELDVAPVILINKFTVKADKIDEFLARSEKPD